ncbi:MAG TPA: hypothetical protein VM869_36995 [Enhygromyxa sp.]|nr:hypothetical protein [Enhygromyxa sp.]
MQWWRLVGVCVGVLALALACERNGASVPPEPVETVEDPPAPIGECGTAAQRFGDYAWIPDDSRLTTAILRDDPELPGALQTLARMVDDPAMQLPILAAIDYRNLSFQLAGLERTLASVELDPGELVELHSPDGDVVWLWPSDCPTETLAVRALDRFAVLVRVDFEHPGMRIGEGSLERFPFDVVLVRERFVALAPLGRGAAVSAWLSAAREDEDGPGVALANLEPAAIRSVLSGPALLTGGGSGTPAQAGRHRRLRVTATEWHDHADSPEN